MAYEEDGVIEETNDEDFYGTPSVEEDYNIVSKKQYSENTGVPKEDIISKEVGVIYGKPPKDKPSDAALKMFEEWKGIENNIRNQLGWFDPSELPNKLNSDWDDEYKKRTGLSWKLMEAYATKQELNSRKEFMSQKLGGYKSMFSSIERDVSAAKSMWKTQRAKQLKEEEKKLQMAREAEANPVLNLYNKAKAGDMEAWNELYNMQRSSELAEEAERERKMRIEAAKPVKMTKLNQYESREKERELKALAKEVADAKDTMRMRKPPEKPTKEDLASFKEAEDEYLKAKNEYDSVNNEYRSWLSRFEGEDISDEQKVEDKTPIVKTLTAAALNKYRTAAKKLGASRYDTDAVAARLAMKDGYSIPEREK
jgi:hypothetical protein